MFIANIEKIFYQEMNTNDLNYSNSYIRLKLFRQRKLLLDGSEYYSTYSSIYNMLVTLGLAGTGSSTFNIFDYRGAYLRSEGSAVFNNVNSATRITNPNPGPIGGDIFNGNVSYVANIRQPDHTHIVDIVDGLQIYEDHTHNYQTIIGTGNFSDSGDDNVGPSDGAGVGNPSQSQPQPQTSANSSALIISGPSAPNFVQNNTIPATLQAATVVSSQYIPLTLSSTNSPYNTYDPLLGSCSANDLAPSSVTVFYAMSF